MRCIIVNLRKLLYWIECATEENFFKLARYKQDKWLSMVAVLSRLDRAMCSECLCLGGKHVFVCEVNCWLEHVLTRGAVSLWRLSKRLHCLRQA